MVLEIADRGPCAASSDAGRAPRRRDARIHPAPGERARCRPGEARGLEVSPGCLLQNQLVQRQVGNRSAQPRVLSLEILQSLDLVALEPAKLLAPAVVRDLRNPIERTASATLCPCDTSTSTWRSFATISSGLCLFLGIEVLLGSKAIPQGGPLQRGRLSFCSWSSSGSTKTRKEITVRIAQIAPLAEAVPPKLYGGTERVVSWLTEELVAEGHEVTLFASGDSKTSAKLVPCVPQGLRLAGIRDHIASHLVMLNNVRRRADQFDVIHFHIDLLQYPLFQDLAHKCVSCRTEPLS